MNIRPVKSSKLRVSDSFLDRQRAVTEATQEASVRLDNNFIRRLDKLIGVRRFTITWLALIVLLTSLTITQTLGLNALYQVDKPARGGTYNEGIIGAYSNANPLYATGSVDMAVSRLLFSGLLKYDDTNSLVGDLANDYTIDETGKIYTVHLKPNLQWHDGKPLTAEDVVFTYGLVQNADARSPLAQGWRGISITSPDPLTVVFSLPSVFAPFPHSLTTGIIPKHILASVTPAQLRTHSFNTMSPVGSGPFKWGALQYGAEGENTTSSLISLKANPTYYSGRPQVDNFVIHTFPDEEQAVAAYKKRRVNALAGLRTVPEDIAKTDDTHVIPFQTTAADMVFLKTSAGVLADSTVRQALVYATDRKSIIEQIDEPLKMVRQPILMDQPGFDSAYMQPTYNNAKAKAILDQAGWVPGKDGIRSKNGQPLMFQLYLDTNPQSKKIVDELVYTWKEVGVNAIPVMQRPVDFQTSLELHTYDAVLHGISIGPDPDVYPYWHSSQANGSLGNNLNFSEYKSSVADAALEAGRTRLEPAVRSLKYKPFMQAWYQDNPAIGLFRPRIYYVTRGEVHGLVGHTLNTDTDRYFSVANWNILMTRADKN